MAPARFVPPDTTLEAFIEEQANKNALSKTKRDVYLLKEFMRMKGKDEEFVSFSLIGFLSFRYFANMVYKAWITKKTISDLHVLFSFNVIINKLHHRKCFARILFTCCKCLTQSPYYNQETRDVSLAQPHHQRPMKSYPVPLLQSKDP